MMEESLEAILALFRGESRSTGRPTGSPSATAACSAGRTPPASRGRGRGDGLAVGPPAGRRARRVAAVAVDVGGRGLRRDRPGLGRGRGAGAKAGHPRPTAARGGCSAPCTSPTHGAGHRGLHPRPQGLRQLLRRRRRVRAAGQHGRRRGRRRRGTTSRPTPSRATWSSARPTTPSPTSRGSSSSPAGSAPSSCSATTGPTRRRPSARTGSSPARWSRTSSTGWRRPEPRTSGRSSKRNELFGRAGQAMLNAITSHVEEKATQRRPGRRRLMRAAALRDGEIVVRDDVPEPDARRRSGPRPGEGLRHLRVGPALRHPRRRDARPHRGDGGHARRSAARRSTSPRTSSWATSSPPRCSRSGRTRSAGAGHARHVDPGPVSMTGVHADRLQQRRCRGATASGCSCRRRCSLEVPNGLDPRHAALTEPMAVGLHAVNRSRHHAGRRCAGARLRSGRPGRDRRAALEGHRADRGGRLLPGTPRAWRWRWAPTRRSTPATSRRSTRGRGWARLAPSWCSRPSACRGSSTTSCARAPAHPRRRRRRVHGARHDQPVLRHRQGAEHPVRASGTTRWSSPARSAIAEGEIDVAPMITGEVDLDGVAGAFAALADPEEHCKILVTP